MDVVLHTDPITGRVAVATPVGHSVGMVVVLLRGRGITTQTVDSAQLPQDRAFRNAWEFEDAWEFKNLSKPVKENWISCVEITKARLRAERAPLLEAIDIQALRDIETTGSVKKATADRKQALRDITLRADAATTRDELLSIKAA